MHIDHLGIAVPSLREVIDTFKFITSSDFCHEDEVADQKVRVASFQVGESLLEFLEPTSDESPIAKFLAKKGAGLHHVALAVDDIGEELARLKAGGMRLIDEKPRTGAHGKLIAFIHPGSTGGILVELCSSTLGPPDEPNPQNPLPGGERAG
jgi:methylmalonyl-CoA epimerase